MSAKYRVLLLPLLPIALIAYACSDSTETPGETDGGTQQDGSNPGNDGGGSDFDGSSTDTDGATDSGTDTGITDGGAKDASDAGDANVVTTCLGNPLSADGGGPDSGVVLTANSLATLLAGNFFDGPQWIGNRLAFSDVYNGQLLTMLPDGGNPSPFRTGITLPIGNALRKVTFDGGASADGILLTVTAGNGSQSILQTFLDGGVLPTVALTNVGAPNDLAVGNGNTVYVTDPAFQQGNTTSLFRTNDGGKLPIQTFNVNGEHPNGVALSPDGLSLYVSLTPEKQILKYTANASGAITGEPNATGTVLVQSAIFGANEPDGLAVDVGGNLWVAAGNFNNNNGKLMVFSPTGNFLGEIPVTGSVPTGVAFGGDDGKSVFVTTSTSVLRYTSRCVGLK